MKRILLFSVSISLLSLLFLSALVVAQTGEQKKLEIDDFVSQADKTFEKTKKVFTVKEK